MIDIPDIQKDIELTKNRIRALQSETVHCVAIKPTGKVEIVDKGKLEELNSEVDRLAALSSGNGAVLARLQELTGGKSMADLIERKRKLADHIQKTKDLLRHDQAELLKRSPGLDLAGMATDPRAQKLQADAQAVIAGEMPELEEITALLTQADEILAGYRPSGLRKAIPRHTPFVGGF